MARNEYSHAIITDMEPKLPAPERMSEYSHAPSIPAPEREMPRNAERLVEQQERGSERAVGNQMGPGQPTLPPVVVPSPLPAVDATMSVSPGVDVPVVANDDDLIEKEWVDKAKQILATTKDDPYRREKEVSKLQVEYLKKRYGKELVGLE